MDSRETGSQSFWRGRVAAGRVVVVAGMAAAIASLVLASAASAGLDPLKGGSLTMQLRGGKGLKVRPHSLALGITGGAVDPITGAGTVSAPGQFKAKMGGHKAKVKILSFIFGANGSPGTITAQVGKNKVAGFGTLLGGTVARTPTFGATISNVSATLSSKGAKAIRGGSGKGRKSTAGAAKGGKPLGTVSVTTIPSSVEVVPGSGTMVLNSDPMGAFVSKLASHCIDPTPILASPPGITPIAPAVASGPLGNIYTFPVTGGSVAPDFSDGKVVTGGGQILTKNTGPMIPGGCASSSPPTGTQIPSVNFETQFSTNLLATNTTLPGAAPILGPLGDLDYSTGTRSFDPSTNTLTVTNATVRLDPLAAGTLNLVLPNESGTASNDWAPGDLIGTLSVTAKIR